MIFARRPLEILMMNLSKKIGINSTEIMVNINDVRKLINKTGAGYKDCIDALKNSNSFNEALEKLKNYSVQKVRSFSSSDSKEIEFGILIIKELNNKVIYFILHCESDLVEKSSDFINFSNYLTDLFFENFENITNSSDAKFTFEKLAENEIIRISLLTKEKIHVEDFGFFIKNDSELIGIYIHHNKKLGAFSIIESGNSEIAHEIAIHVAVNEPKFISKNDIDNDVLNLKFEEIKESLSEEIKKKSEVMIENVIKGKLNKWFSEICLLSQQDFRNSEKTIGDIINQNKAKIRKIKFLKILNSRSLQFN